MQHLITGKSSSPSNATKSVSTESFATDVLKASYVVPVIVDFWATWCGPCKTIGPILEKAVAETNGAVRLVKLDINKYPEIPAQLRVQSVPTVYAFKDGYPVDGFVGALPESKIKSFVKKIAALGGKEPPVSPLADAFHEAENALAAGDYKIAATFFTHILQHEPKNAKALAGLGRCYLALGAHEKVKTLLEGLEEEVLKTPEVAALVTSFALIEQATGVDSVLNLQAKLAHNPNDHQARFDLAMAHFVIGQRDEAVEALLELIKRDRKWKNEAGRIQLIKFFEAFGSSDPLTILGRRRLSKLLFV